VVAATFLQSGHRNLWSYIGMLEEAVWKEGEMFSADLHPIL
jgi:hypothetical protein